MFDRAPKSVISVDFYKQPNGREVVREWLRSLPKEERRIIGEDIKMVQDGWPLGMPLVRSLGKKLWEVRSTLPNTIARVLFIMHEGQMVLLHGFIKKTQQTPQHDIDIALARAKEVKKG
ncbi:MAG TPA: type II toxin-antitoxin system RelE/ParE family toxin [Rhabdochlamydiaceae bacterium]|nr:type II toxin-antitoxin system RelE/ParE family toxin [Rhabdochlamydiaceae bacterium]